MIVMYNLKFTTYDFILLKPFVHVRCVVIQEQFYFIKD